MIHIPVLLKEAIKYLDVKEKGIYVDATLGFGGHSKEILKRAKKGLLIGIEWDESALKEAKVNLEKFKNKKLILENFVNLKKILKKLKIEEIDGILFDLGVNLAQLQDSKRGFSFQKEGPLDMRMTEDLDLTASEIVNKWPEKELIRIFKENNERFARKIARKIVREREKKPILTTLELANIVKSCYRKRRKIHPATLVFQALRIEVNKELENLKLVLPQAVDSLKKGGRLVVISFHSGEDRIVKTFIKEEKRLINLTKKPIVPTPLEIRKNPRARSAKLRAAEKIGE